MENQVCQRPFHGDDVIIDHRHFIMAQLRIDYKRYSYHLYEQHGAWYEFGDAVF